jgi:predicted phosphate transport protein (TIGR00153 family)
LRAVADEIRHLEHEADVAKQRVRDNLPRSAFLSVDRRDFLDALSSLDAIADCAEDVAVLFTLRRMEPHDELMGPLKSLVLRVMEVVRQSCAVASRMSAISDAGFKGAEARRTLDMIEELGRLEHEADIVQDELARRLFGIESEISTGSLLIWNKIFNKLGDMANHAERAGNRLRLLFAA